MKEFVALGYAGPKPVADTGTTTLYDSTAGTEPGSTPNLGHFRRYLLSLQNNAAGTFKVSASRDRGKTWDPPFLTKAIASGTSEIVVPLGVHVDVKVEWTNGGVAQSTWVVEQGLDDGDAPQGVLSDSGGSSTSTTSITSTQLPLVLGQQNKAGSLSVVEASDGVMTKAASLRGYLRTEGLPITCGTASKTFTVPAAWKGLHIRMQAEGGDVYYQISTAAGTSAVADKTARAAETGGPPIALSAPVSGNGCFRIPGGTFLDIPFPLNAETFALQASADASVCRTHPAES